MDRVQRASFDRYFQEQVRRAGAITPGQKKALIDQLRRETREAGRVPLPTGPVVLDVNHPVVRAALEGRPVSLGGHTVHTRTVETPSSRLQRLSLPAKLGLLVALFVLPCLLVFAIATARSDDQEGEAAVVVAPTASPTATLTPSPTASPTQPPTATATPSVTPTPMIIEVTPTPYSLALTTGPAASGGNDPASIELAGLSYVLTAGVVKDGVWQPAGAEWLVGTELRRVIAVPYEANIAQAISNIHSGNVIKLRLRSGEIVKYRVTEVARRMRHEIEILAARTPSLAVVLHGEPNAERWVIAGDAIQEPGDFGIYTAGIPVADDAATGSGLAASPPAPIATTFPTTTQTTITTSQTITHTAAGLVLAVGTCNRVERIGEQEPPRNSERFLICQVTLTALRDGAEYSGQALAITEQEWIESAADWWPPAVAISNGLASGQLNQNNQATGNVAGTVKRGSSLGNASHPVMIWEQAGTRHIIKLTP